MKKLIVAVAVLAMMAGSAYAAEWNFYGQAKIYTFWADVDEIAGPDGDVQYEEGLYGSSRIGAKVKVSDELAGRFEYGASDGKANIRLLYGTWNFGSGTLTVGQDYTPVNVTYSSQFASDDDLGLGGYGDFDMSRNPELKLTFGGFSIAFLAPETDDFATTSTVSGVTYTTNKYSTQSVIPMIAANYMINFDMGEFQIAGAYNTFEVNDDEDVNSYGIGLGGQLNFGALSVFGTFVWAQNSAYLKAGSSTEYGGEAVYAAGDVDDCESIGGTIGMIYAVNDMLTFEAGYGYIHDEMDSSDVSDIAQSYYLQAAVTMAPGVTVTPEVGVIDHREDGQNEAVYFGAAWKICF